MNIDLVSNALNPIDCVFFFNCKFILSKRPIIGNDVHFLQILMASSNSLFNSSTSNRIKTSLF